MFVSSKNEIMYAASTKSYAAGSFMFRIRIKIMNRIHVESSISRVRFVIIYTREQKARRAVAFKKTF